MVTRKVQSTAPSGQMSARLAGSSPLAAMKPVEAAKGGQWFAIRCRCGHRASIGPHDYGNSKVPSVEMMRAVLRCRECGTRGMAAVTPVWR